MRYRYDEVLDLARPGHRILFISKFWREANAISNRAEGYSDLIYQNDHTPPFALLFCGCGYQEVLQAVRKMAFQKVMLVDTSRKPVFGLVANKTLRITCKVIGFENESLEITSMQKHEFFEDFSRVIETDVFNVAWGLGE